MTGTTRGLGLSAALLLGAASTAAATTFDFGTFCGGNSFSTCASVEINYTSGNSFTLELSNPGGVNPGTFGSTFTAIGFNNLSGMDLTGGSASGYGSWSYDDTLTEINGESFNGFSGFDRNPGNPAVTGLPVGQTVTFTFTFTGTFDLNGSQLAMHGQQGPNDCSTKLRGFIGPNNTLTGTNSPSGSESERCGGGPPDTTVPEPITMTLLGTGLAGMGGANVLRRRRKNDDEIG